MLQNNIFLVDPSLRRQTLAIYVAEPVNHPVIEITWHRTFCPDKDTIAFNPRRRINQEVFVHELLHDVWYTVLTPSSKNSFSIIIRRLLYARGTGLGHRDLEDREVDRLFLLTSEREEKEFLENLHSFAKTFPPEERNDVINALSWYRNLRVGLLVEIKLEYKHPTREYFIEREAYPIIFERGLIVNFLEGYYSPFLSAATMQQALHEQHDNRHLSSMDAVESFLNIIKRFIDRLQSSSMFR